MKQNVQSAKEWLELEMKIDRSRWAVARKRAEEIVQDMGYNKGDEEYEVMVHCESKQLWDEANEREMYKRSYDYYLHDEE